MIYKLKENIYSSENIDILVRNIRSSLAKHTALVSDINYDNNKYSFYVAIEHKNDTKHTICITDEYDRYGGAALVFNIYINDEEYGPMAYNSEEIACNHASNFIFNKLVKQQTTEAVNYSKTDVDGPYNYRDVYSELANATNGFIIPEDKIKYGYESEANYAVKILKRHYNKVELNKVGRDFVIRFTDNKKKPKIETVEADKPIDENDEELLTEFAYKIDDLKAYYNSASCIDKDKYPNFFAWYDAMKKQGKLNTSSTAVAFA